MTLRNCEKEKTTVSNGPIDSLFAIADISLMTLKNKMVRVGYNDNDDAALFVPGHVSPSNQCDGGDNNVVANIALLALHHVTPRAALLSS